MKLPHALLGALTGLPGFNSEAFEQVHEQPESLVSLRFNPDKMPGMEAWLPLQQRVPWSRQGWYLEERPSFTLDPLFHAGAYYVQEASSMFIEEAIRQITIGESPL
ncbi:MAG TPA: RNA methyltransferase, partial [Chitinophagaceae bacterium]|nr:RNA methyltransferase [Chitinophagaceae bacterium]